MPIPVNCVPEDALVIPSIPYSITIADVFLSPQDTAYPTTCDTTGYHPLWWKYTVPVGINYVVFNANGDGVFYFPQLSIFTGTPPSLTQYEMDATQFFCGAPGFDHWWSVPVISGTTYYIRFTDWDGSAPVGAELALVFNQQPYVTAPPGSIVIPDDFPQFPTVVIGANGDIYQTPPGLLVGEFAASLPDGTICGSKGQGSAAEDAVIFYDSNWTQFAEVTLGDAPERVVANETHFYVSDNSGTLYQFSGAGVQLDTWTPTALASNEFIVVNRAGTRCYYSSGAENTNVRTWNLDTDTAGATFFTWPNNRQLQADWGTLENDNIWLLDSSQVTLLDQHIVIRDGTTGAILNTFTLPLTGTDNGHHACYYPGAGTPEDPESIWIWIYKQFAIGAVEVFEFVRMDVSDGSTFASFQVNGASVSGEPSDPNTPIAPSDTCPLIVLRQTLVPPETPEGEGSEILGFATELPIRWVIRTGITT